jgi:hypothetical protein
MKLNRLRLQLIHLCFAFVLGNFNVFWSQNAIVGTLPGTCWGAACSNNSACIASYFTQSAGTSYISPVYTNISTGNQYWRFVLAWSGTYYQYTNSPGTDVDVTPGVKYTLNSTCTGSGALRYNVPSTSYNYLFKTRNISANPSGDWVFFQLQGTVRSISSLTQVSAPVVPATNATVSVNLDGALSTGQTVWLRYATTSNFSNSTCVKMTGSGTSYSADIPSSTNTSGTTVYYYAFTSGDVSSIAGTDSDLYTINLMNNSGSNYSYTVSGYSSTQNGDWNSASTWLGGNIPAAGSQVTINNDITVNSAVSTAYSSLTISASKTLSFGSGGSFTATTVTNNGTINMSAGGTLTIASGGTLANGTNTFTYGTGTVTFAGSGTVTGTIGFNNVTIAGGVNFGSASTINGTLTINTGGYVNTNAPSYAVGSTLKYNTGNASAYGRSTEWSSLSGAGYPHHVQISNNTTLNVNNATNVARQAAGNLTVDSGSTLSLEGMTIASPTVIGLTFGGNITNNGTITLATATERLKCVDYTNLPGAITTLSSNVGGDLEVTGSFVDNGTYNANARAIFFTGTGTQNISGSGTFDIDYMVMNKASGEVVMLNDLKCEGPNGGNVITLTNNTDVLNLNGFDVIFGKSGVTSVATGSGKLKGHVNSDITILGTGSFGTLNFDNANNTIGALTLNRTTSGSFSLGSNLIVSGTLTLSDGYLSIGAYTLECQNAVSVSSGSLRGSSSSSLILSGGNSTAELKMDNTTPGTTNLLSALTLSKTGASSAVNISADVIVNGNLTISGNATNMLNPNKQLTVNGVLTNNGLLSMNSGSTLVQGSSSTVSGSGSYDIQQNVTGSGGITPNGRFWYLGSPLTDGSSSALMSYTGDQLWQWNESSFAYSSLASGQALTQGKSYVLRSGQANGVIHFLGSGLSNGTVTVSGLTRTGTTQTYRGCHLISNPYPSYLDWDMVGKTNVSTTMYIRTASGSTIDILETYNSANGQGTNISGPAMTKYIAPMQGFWVKVAADGQTGSLTMNNSMRSHQASGSGLRSSAIDFPAYLRFNMIDGQNKDQVILLMSPDATMSLDAFDSEKMPASGYGQFYSTVNAKKLVINGMKNVKAKTSVPLTLELPTSKSYTFQAEEFNIEDGLILLEDKQEGIIQDLTINPTYTFFNNAGTNATRFVVHLQLASEPVLVGGPQELENLGMDQLSTDNIQITSNNQGTVIVRLDEGFKPEGSIRIFDASGRLVDQRDFNDQETTIQLNEQAGMYFVEVTSGKLMVKKKIVIN